MVPENLCPLFLLIAYQVFQSHSLTVPVPVFQDIGFDGISPLIGTDNNVVNVYFDLYFPKAVSSLA
jgi:hypothetical protein